MGRPRGNARRKSRVGARPLSDTCTGQVVASASRKKNSATVVQRMARVRQTSSAIREPRRLSALETAVAAGSNEPGAMGRVATATRRKALPVRQEIRRYYDARSSSSSFHRSFSTDAWYRIEILPATLSSCLTAMHRPRAGNGPYRATASNGAAALAVQPAGAFLIAASVPRRDAARRAAPRSALPGSGTTSPRPSARAGRRTACDSGRRAR